MRRKQVNVNDYLHLPPRVVGGDTRQAALRCRKGVRVEVNSICTAKVKCRSNRSRSSKKSLARRNSRNTLHICKYIYIYMCVYSLIIYAKAFCAPHAEKTLCASHC
jgi:hypothetical protein